MPRRITPLRDLLAVGQIWWCLRRIRPHIVHAHTPKAGLLGMIGAWLARVPVRIYHNHGMPYLTETGARRFLLRWSEVVASFFAHEVICVSHSVRAVAVADRICSPEKIKVLLGGSINGVDAMGRFHPDHVSAATRAEVRRAAGIPDDAVVAGFVGRIIRRKGIVDLAAAWPVLREQFPNLHLLILGESEPKDAVPPEVMEALRADPRVHMPGHTEDTPPVYANMDVLVLPTYLEGLPMVLLEGSAMGLPIVATRIPGCVEAVEEDVTGVLVPPGDVDALTRAVGDYLKSPDRARRHGRAGRERMLREFRQEAIWEAFEHEYRRLLRQQVGQLPARQPAASRTM